MNSKTEKIILFVCGYDKKEGYQEDDIRDFTSFEFDNIKEVYNYIQIHKKHCRDKDIYTYGYEIIFEECQINE